MTRKFKFIIIGCFFIYFEMTVILFISNISLIIFKNDRQPDTALN